MLSITFQPQGITVSVAAGSRFSDALQEADIEFAYPCAGAKLCGRCRVNFNLGAPEPTAEEKRLLAFKDIESGVRLACCCVLSHDAEVELPDGEASGHMEHILKEGVRSDLVVDPEVIKCACKLPASTLEEPKADWVRIRQALPEDRRLSTRPTLSVLQKLPDVVKCAEQNGGMVTLTLRENRVIDVECGDKTEAFYGIALDLGTTTLSAALVDMRSGEELAVTGRLNPQRSFGHDLISRIHAVQEDYSKLDTLHERITETIGELIVELCLDTGVKADDVSAMAVAGNTVMEHLFLRIDPRPLGVAPFAGTLRTGVRFEASDFDLPIHPSAPVYVLPCMGGFVGGDISAGVLVTRLADLKGVNILVDIGTNGEVVVAKDGRLMATSSAAGPSFEGGKIECGMIAAEGAIHAARVENDDLVFDILGQGPAKGVCGSGLMEVFARCLEAGLISMNGRITSPEAAAELPEAMRNRLAPDQSSIFLAKGENGRDIVLTQDDIREFQLGKGAVQTAILMVLEEMGVALDSIDRFLVAGAFGRHLNIRDAMTLGLLPDLDESKVSFVGNSSLEGARCVLLNKYERSRADRISEQTGFVELASRPEFQERFAMAMMLGPAMMF